MAKKNAKENKKSRKGLVLVLAVLLLGITVGYATLSQTLNITGSTKINSTGWNVHFTNVEVNEYIYNGADSLGTFTNQSEITATSGTTLTSTAPAASLAISQSSATGNFTEDTLTYSADFKIPGDSITFTATITNDGTIPARVSSITDGIHHDFVENSDTDFYDAQVYTSLTTGTVINPGSSVQVEVTVTFDSRITNTALNALTADQTTPTGTYSVAFEQE